MSVELTRTVRLTLRLEHCSGVAVEKLRVTVEEVETGGRTETLTVDGPRVVA